MNTVCFFGMLSSMPLTGYYFGHLDVPGLQAKVLSSLIARSTYYTLTSVTLVKG